MPALTMANFLAYVLQIAAVVVIGAGLPTIVRLRSPRARLTYWRTLLLVCLALPLVQPLTPALPSVPFPAVTGNVDVPAGRAGFGLRAAATAVASAKGVAGADAVWPLGRLAAALVVAGITARLAWLGIGLVTLGRIRKRAIPLEPRPAAIDEASLLTGADAEFRIIETIARPVTFGAAKPVVIVPREFSAFGGPQQIAVACHELVHVRRYDWLRTIGDELVRAFFWFHPAIWFVLDRIHLAAEQVVDQEVVAITGARQPYLEALVRLAAPTPRVAFGPATLFIRQSHLRERVTLLLKEVSMSRTRLAVSFMAMAAVLVVSGRLVVAALPLQGTVPVHARGPALISEPDPVPAPTVEPQAAPAAKPQGSLRPGEPVPEAAKPNQTGSGLTKIHDVRPVYPPEAAAAGTSGAVILAISIDAAGVVTDARVLKGDVLLAGAAVDAVRQWRYRPPASAPVTATIAVNVVDTEQPAAVPDSVRVGGDIKPPTKIRHLSPVYPEAAKQAGVQGVVIAEAKIDPAGTITDARILRSIPLLDVAALDALMQWKFTPTLLNGAPVPVIMTVTVNFVLDSTPKTTGAQGGAIGGVVGGAQMGGVIRNVPGGAGGGYEAALEIYQRLLDNRPAPPAPEGALRVGGNIGAPTKVKHVSPIYPEEAKAAGVQGVVIAELVVGKDGKVESAKILRSIPELDQAAVDAVKQWEFTPTLVNGSPVPVIMTVTVNFTLK